MHSLARAWDLSDMRCFPQATTKLLRHHISRWRTQVSGCLYTSVTSPFLRGNSASGNAIVPEASLRPCPSKASWSYAHNDFSECRMEDPGVEILVYIKDNFIALCYTQRDVPPPLIHSTLPFGKGQVRSRAADEVAFFVALSALHEFSFDRAGVGASCKEEKDRLHCMVLADHTGTRGVDGEGIGLLADQEAAVRQDSCRAEAQGMCCDVDAREKFCDYSDVGLSLSMRGKGRSGEESSCCTEVKVTGSGTERKWCKDKPLDDGCVLQGDSESVGGRGLVCLDPMCGVGTFPLALAFVLRRHHPTRCGGMKIWGTEECEESVSTANRNLRPGTTEASSAVEQDESQHDVQAVPRDSQPSETSIAFAVEQADDLSFLANDSVDMIVVDPPWGHRHGGFKVLNKMTVRWVREWGRVLRPHTGVMAIVTIRTTQMENMVLPQLHRQIGLRLIRPPIVFDNKGFHFCKLFLIKKVPEEATAVPTKSFT